MLARRPLIVPLLIALLSAGPAAAQNPMPAVEADQWEAAATAAAQYPDPVAAKLVTFYRVLDPGAASAAEIAAFLEANPDWPFQALLHERLDQAIASEPDDAAALQLCRADPPTSAAALLRCATAERTAGNDTAAGGDARRAWIAGDFSPAMETTFLAQWGNLVSSADQWQRFAHLVSVDAGAAARQVPRLAADDQAAATAWLGLIHSRSGAWDAYAALPHSTRREPGLFLAAARWLEQQGNRDQAVELWRQDGAAAQNAAPAGLLPGFWRERSSIAFDLLRVNSAQPAYAIVSESVPIDRRDALDRDFLAGFIALRWLHDYVDAARHFQALADASPAAITQGRAHYWLGRTAAAGGDAKGAEAQYRQAAVWLTTYYGQLAALALDNSSSTLQARIRAVQDPGWTREQALDFASREVTRAAGFLVAWSVPRRARAFVLRLVSLAPDAAVRSMAARLALGFGLPDQAVAASRLAGVYGEMLPQSGWPIPFHPPAGPIDPAVTLGIVRQESSFDVAAASPSGALGLMQLMPATAKQVARSLGERVALAALTTDPDQNMALGAVYLQGLLDRFDGALPLALAAYNAGPENVAQWIAENGDPRTGDVDMIDWIELIPYGETRDYVERVIESIAVYQAKLNENRPYPLAKWLHH